MFFGLYMNSFNYVKYVLFLNFELAGIFKNVTDSLGHCLYGRENVKREGMHVYDVST